MTTYDTEQWDTVVRLATDAELDELLRQTAAALVRRDIGQRGVYRAAWLRDRVLREQRGRNPHEARRM